MLMSRMISTKTKWKRPQWKLLTIRITSAISLKTKFPTSTKELGFDFCLAPRFLAAITEINSSNRLLIALAFCKLVTGLLKAYFLRLSI